MNETKRLNKPINLLVHTLSLVLSWLIEFIIILSEDSQAFRLKKKRKKRQRGSKTNKIKLRRRKEAIAEKGGWNDDDDDDMAIYGIYSVVVPKDEPSKRVASSWCSTALKK